MMNSNPLLNESTFNAETATYPKSTTMTVQGTMYKTCVMLAILIVTATLTWVQASRATAGYEGIDAARAAFQAVSHWFYIGVFGGLITAFITIFKKDISPITAPIYAAFEGLFLGGFSCYINTIYPGVASQAVLATLVVFAVMLVLYSTRIIPVTQKFIVVVSAATIGLMVFYAIAFICSFFGTYFSILSIHNASAISIGFSAFAVILASLNLMLDFNMIEYNSDRGAPKYMEWYGAFALMVTLIWLYIELLRLLAKLNKR